MCGSVFGEAGGLACNPARRLRYNSAPATREMSLSPHYTHSRHFYTVQLLQNAALMSDFQNRKFICLKHLQCKHFVCVRGYLGVGYAVGLHPIKACFGMLQCCRRSIYPLPHRSSKRQKEILKAFSPNGHVHT